MSEIEIALAQAYLSASGQDPIAALIRSVRDLARIKRMLASPVDPLACDPGDRRTALGARSAERS